MFLSFNFVSLVVSCFKKVVFLGLDGIVFDWLFEWVFILVYLMKCFNNFGYFEFVILMFFF